MEIEIRQTMYMDNIVEQEHLSIKRIVQPMLILKSSSACVPLSGIELVRINRKGQLKNQIDLRQPSVEIFYSLAAQFLNQWTL